MSKTARGILDLLEVFCTNNYPLGITELSNITLNGKSAIYQKIKILENLEYIEQIAVDTHQPALTNCTQHLLGRNAARKIGEMQALTASRLRA